MTRLCFVKDCKAPVYQSARCYRHWRSWMIGEEDA